MIAVDWGSSSLRLYRINEAGNVHDRRRSAQGVFACEGRFREVLGEHIAEWDDEDILMCGMVGGRGGWREVPYLDCPVDCDALAAGLHRLPDDLLPGRRLWIVPGVRDNSQRVADVMRGEETQLAALLDSARKGTHVICLPGTHSKWVTLIDGRISRIRTALTGEMYALLRRHGTLAPLFPETDGRFDPYGFDAGLQRSAQSGGLLHHLFGVRTSALFRQFEPEALPSYLSGLLIGHELNATGILQAKPRPAQVHLIGNDRLLGHYAHALMTLGIGVLRHPEELSARGLHLLWAIRPTAAPDRSTP